MDIPHALDVLPRRLALSGAQPHLPLVMGKGSSLERFSEIPREKYLRVGLNEVCGITPVHLAVYLDYEHWINSLNPSGQVVLPWRPHWEGKPGNRTLEQMLAFDCRLRQLALQERLSACDLRTTMERHWPGRPVLPVWVSTLEMAAYLLLHLGHREWHTLGIGDSGIAERWFDAPVEPYNLDLPLGAIIARRGALMAEANEHIAEEARRNGWELKVTRL